MNYFLIFLNFYVMPLHLAYPTVVKKDLQKQYLSEPETIFTKVDEASPTQNEQVTENTENKSKYLSKYLRTEAYNPINDYKYRRLQESNVNTKKYMQSDNKHIQNTDDSKYIKIRQEAKQKTVKDKESQGKGNKHVNRYLRPQQSNLKTIKGTQSEEGVKKYLRTHDFNTENGNKYLSQRESNAKKAKDMSSHEIISKNVNKYLRPLLQQQSDSKTEKIYLRTHDSNTENGKKLQRPKAINSKIVKDIDLRKKINSKYLQSQESNLKTEKVMESQENNSKLKTVKDIQIDRKYLSTKESKKENKFKPLIFLPPNEIKKQEEIQDENLHKIVKKKNDEIIEMLRDLARQHGYIKKNKDVDSRRDTVKILESQSLRDLKERVVGQEVVKKGEQLKKEVEEMKKQAEEAEQERKLREHELSKQQETEKEPRKDLDAFDIAFGLDADSDTGDSSSSSMEHVNHPLMRASSDSSESEEQLNFKIAGESLYMRLF